MGRFLLGNDAFNPADIYALDLQSGLATERKLTPVVGSPQSNEVHGRFSPDGNWFAYASNESGEYEIYVRPWDTKAGRPGTGGLTIVSKGGARAGGAVWRREGKEELYYLSLDGSMMAVDVTVGSTFSAQTPHALFKIDAPNLFFFDATAEWLPIRHAVAGEARRHDGAVQGSTELDLHTEEVTSEEFRNLGQPPNSMQPA